MKICIKMLYFLKIVLYSIIMFCVNLLFIWLFLRCGYDSYCFDLFDFDFVVELRFVDMDVGRD